MYHYIYNNDNDIYVEFSQHRAGLKTSFIKEKDFSQ
jgi:hypothetical protein